MFFVKYHKIFEQLFWINLGQLDVSKGIFDCIIILGFQTSV